jgi:hypothetical protein
MEAFLGLDMPLAGVLESWRGTLLDSNPYYQILSVVMKIAGVLEFWRDPLID